MSDDLINHRLKALEEENARAATWRASTTTQIADLSATVKTALALGEQRMNAIDKHVEHTDSTVEEVVGRVSDAHKTIRSVSTEVQALTTQVGAVALENKRDPRAFYTAIASGLTAIAAGIVAFFKGHP